jgi:hypothetical protein
MVQLFKKDKTNDKPRAILIIRTRTSAVYPKDLAGNRSFGGIHQRKKGVCPPE